MYKTLLLLVLTPLCFTMTVYSEEADTAMKDVGYILGYQMGRDLQRSGKKYDVTFVLEGFEAGVMQKDPKYSEEQMRTIMSDYRQSYQKRMQDRKAQAAGINLIEGKEFMSKNKEMEGVITLPSGLQYQILQKGSGSIPKLNEKVKTNYEGTLIDGTVFDSSYQRGQSAQFPVSGVIKGWQEALQLMPVGSKWKLTVPSNLAYGERGAGNLIGPNQTLVFTIELLEIIS